MEEERRRRRRKRKKNKKEGCERREKMEEVKKYCDRPNHKVTEHHFDQSPSERMHCKKRRHAAVEKVDALELNERQRSKKKEKPK